MSRKAFWMVGLVLFLSACTDNPAQPSSAAAQDKKPAAKPGNAAEDYVGQWTCPRRGLMTLVVKDGKVVGTGAGAPGEGWARDDSRGARFTDGTVKDGVLHMKWADGAGYNGTQTIALSADGKSFEGDWEYVDKGRTYKGTWKGHR